MPGPNKRALVEQLENLKAHERAGANDLEALVLLNKLAREAWEDGFLTGVANLPRTNPFAAASVAPLKKVRSR